MKRVPSTNSIQEWSQGCSRLPVKFQAKEECPTNERGSNLNQEALILELFS